MRKDPVIYLNHIQDCIVKIITYTDGLDEQGFLNSTIVQDAVVRNFEIIGEATKQLDSEFREKYPAIEWKKLAGMRDKLIHDYIGVDLWIVWDTAANYIPALQLLIDTIIKTERQNSPNLM